MRFDRELYMVLCSVRELAERAAQGGSLGGAYDSPSAEEGRVLHKLLKDSQGEGFVAEYPISADFKSGSITYRISGRADCVLEADVPIVCEFKTVTHSAFERASSRLGRAQVTVYAALYAISKGAKRVIARLVIATPDGEKIKNSDRTYTADELVIALHALISKIAPLAHNEVEALQNIHPLQKQMVWLQK